MLEQISYAGVIGSLFAGATFVISRAKTTDQFLRDYSSEPYRTALRDLYQFKDKYSAQNTNGFINKWKELGEKRKTLVVHLFIGFNKFHLQSLDHEERKELERIDEARRLLWVFAVRLDYARKYHLFPAKSDAELFGPVFYGAIAKIIKPLQPDKVLSYHKKLLEHAEMQVKRTEWEITGIQLLICHQFTTFMQLLFIK